MRRTTATALIGLLGAGLAAAPAAAAPGGSAGAQRDPARPPVVIGVEAPLSGPQRSNGRDMLRGVRLAVRQVNATGGIRGRQVRIVALDDQAKPALAKAMVAKAKRAGAVAVIGPYNSSVGVKNLPLFLRSRIVPVHLTSTNATDGMGVTVQPKDNQISPVETSWAKGVLGITGITARATRDAAMLVDPSTYTKGMAERFRQTMTAAGVDVTTHAITPGLDDYSAVVNQVLADGPDLVYVATYYPEGAKIAQALTPLGLTAAAKPVPCLMTMSNVDPAFVREAGIPASQRCEFSGVPAAPQQPGAKAAAFVTAYQRAFDRVPGVWGIFTYDSANLVFQAMRHDGLRFAPMLRHLRHVTNHSGATGTITIRPKTGNRVDVPVFVLGVNADDVFEPRLG